MFLAIVKLVCPSSNPFSFVETGCQGSHHSVSASFSPDGGVRDVNRGGWEDE